MELFNTELTGCADEANTFDNPRAVVRAVPRRR